jgi:purine-cytosine permease-like protein
VGAPGRSRPEKPLPTLVTELWDLVVAYAKQETVDPLRALGRFIGFGIPGALLMVVGLILVSVAGLRALEFETNEHLSGNWSWTPYGIVTAFCLIVAGLAVWRIFKRPKGHS